MVVDNTKAHVILPMTVKHINQVSRLHAHNIVGFSSSLGEHFLRCFYGAIVASDYGFGFVAISNNQVIGFVACVQNLAAIYSLMITRNFVRLIGIMFRAMLHFANIRDACEVIVYPKKQTQAGLPAAEIAAIVVSEQYRSCGIGKMLVSCCAKEFWKRKVTALKVLVGEELSANKFYKRAGFQFVKRYYHHKKFLNLYVLSIDADVLVQTAGLVSLSDTSVTTGHLARE